MLPLADIDDFEIRHGDVSDTDRVEALLADASALILAEVDASEEDWVVSALADASGGDAPPHEVVAICVEVAYRAFSNPDALERAQVGDVATYWRPDTPDAVWLTDREKRTIRRAAGTGSMRSVTLTTPYSGDDSDDDHDLDFA